MSEIHCEPEHTVELSGPISLSDLESYNKYPHLDEFELIDDLWIDDLEELKTYDDIYQKLIYYLREFEEIETDDPLEDEDWGGQEVNVKTWKWIHDRKEDIFIDICTFPGDNEQGAIWMNNQVVALNGDMDIVPCKGGNEENYIIKTLAHIRFLGSQCNHKSCDRAWKVRKAKIE